MDIDTSNGHPAMDYKEHLRTYSGFLRASVIMTVLVSLLLIVMLLTLV
jgi:Bacterial aa3 type cytochrome c oxidase subunit IV